MPVLREATLADYEAIAALENANGLKSRSREEWSRFWTENPAYRALETAFPIGWILEDEKTGRVVGTLSNVPLPYALNGRNILAATGRGWAVDPAYRAFAPLLLDEYFNQNVDLLLSTTVNGLAEASHQICEQTRVPVGDWTRAAFRITSYRGFARVALKLKKLPSVLSPLAAVALWCKDRFTAPPLVKAPANLVAASSYEFSDKFDEFWTGLKKVKASKLLGVRTREVLAWHFGAQLKTRRARILTVEDQGRISGYAVLVRSDHTASALTRFRLADFQTLTDNAAVTAALVRKAVDVCQEEEIHALEVVGCGLPALSAFEAIAPYRRSLPAWCYFFHSNDEALLASLQDAALWEPSTFDGDSSI